MVNNRGGQLAARVIVKCGYCLIYNIITFYLSKWLASIFMMATPGI